MHQVHASELARGVRLHERLDDLGRMIGRGPVADVDPLGGQLAAEILEESDPLLAHAVQIDGIALGLERFDAAARLFDEVGVEAAGETAVRGEEDDRRALGTALGRRRGPAEQRKLRRELGE